MSGPKFHRQLNRGLHADAVVTGKSETTVTALAAVVGHPYGVNYYATSLRLERKVDLGSDRFGPREMTMRTILTLLTSLLLSSCASVQNQSCPAPDPLARAAVVPIRAGAGGHGSGVIIAQDRLLTAAHVMGEERFARVRIGETVEWAQTIAIDLEYDLALLDVPTSGLKPMTIASSAPVDSAPVWALGFPRATGQRASRGQFKQVSDGRLYSTAEIDNGDSGGGLLECQHGEYVLAGMIRSYAAYQDSGELVKVPDLSISVPAADIRAFVDANAI